MKNMNGYQIVSETIKSSLSRSLASSVNGIPIFLKFTKKVKAPKITLDQLKTMKWKTGKI